MVPHIRFLIAVGLVLLSACSSPESKAPVFHAEARPEKLSDWGLFSFPGNTLTLNDGVVEYSLNAALFSDYAHKLRTLTVPTGKPAKQNNDGTFEFPAGTIISKTFYYPKAEGDKVVLEDQSARETALSLNQYRLIETRLLVKRESGWEALPYVWNDEQTDAILDRFGSTREISGEYQGEAVSFSYAVPDTNQCAACHQWDADKPLQPIGPQVRHLNGEWQKGTSSENQVSKNQLTELVEKGLLELTAAPAELPANANVYAANADGFDINERARAYLDINCSHCHNPKGPGNTSGLHLEAFRAMSQEVGLCKLPIAAGAGTGDRPYDIYPSKPELSIFSYRLASTEPEKMMPELGRALRHQEGVDLVNEWILSLKGDCKN